MSYLFFVEWKKGPKNYLKYSPYIFYTLTYLNYLIIPIANIGYFFILAFAVKSFKIREIFIESWVVFYVMVSFNRILEYFIEVKKNIILDARNYLA